MRNLKRALSLTLASVMLLGMMVVGSSAAVGFPDVDENDNVEAIEVLQAVEVMVGDDRGFGPDRPVTRNEMAVVMGKLLNLNYNYYVSSCPFTDVAEWARGWVGACYANGIVSGRGEGIYDGEATVTAIEAASMMMRALGYFKYTEDYADGFQLVTVRQGSEIGIFNMVGTDGNTPMTRNQVAQMALNALKANMVAFTGTPGIEVNGVKVGYKAEYTFRSGTDRKYFAISGQGNTTDGTTNQAYIQLGEELYDGDLRLNDNSTDDFGRPSRYWEYDGKAIGTYMKKELIREEYTDKVTGKMLYELLTKDVVESINRGGSNDYTLSIAIDGEDREAMLKNKGDNGAGQNAEDFYFDIGKIVRGNTDGVGGTGKGVLTQVFVDTNKKTVDIAIINTYLAKADADYASRQDKVTFTVYSVENIGGSSKVLVKNTKLNGAKAITASLDASGEDFDVQDVKEDDIYLVTVAQGEIQTLTKPEVLAETEIDAFKKTSNVTVDGQKYDYATTAKYDDEVLDNYTNGGTTNLKDKTYNVYLDKYGYVIGVEEVEGANNYVFITGYDGDYSYLSNKTADMAAIFPDGTMKTIKVRTNSNDSSADLFTESANNKFAAKGNASPGTDTNGNGVVDTEEDYNAGIVNTWCTYTINDAGEYSLKIVDGTNNQKANQSRQSVTGANKITIDTKRVQLTGADGNFVFGNDETVYINTELEKISIPGGPNGTTHTGTIISDVESVTTGVRNVNLEVTDKTALDAGTTPAAPSSTNFTPIYEVYTLYKTNNRDIIAVVTLDAEDSGSNSVYAYVTSSDVSEEAYSKANNEYTWSREVVINGEKTKITYVGDKLDKIGAADMIRGNWYELKLNADGHVRKVDGLSFTTDTSNKYQSTVASVVPAWNANTSVEILHDTTTVNKLTFSGGTLWTDETGKTGISVATDVKVVVCNANDAGTSYFDSVEDGYTGYSGLNNALSDLNNNFTGTVSAVYDGGRAKILILNCTAAKPSYNGGQNQGNNNNNDIGDVYVNLDELGAIEVYTTKSSLTTPEGAGAILAALEKAGYTVPKDGETGAPEINADGDLVGKVKKDGMTYNIKWDVSANKNVNAKAVNLDGDNIMVASTDTLKSLTDGGTNINQYIKLTEKGASTSTFVDDTDATASTIKADMTIETGYYQVKKGSSAITAAETQIDLAASGITVYSGDGYAKGTSTLKVKNTVNGTGVKVNDGSTDWYFAYGSTFADMYAKKAGTDYGVVKVTLEQVKFTIYDDSVAGAGAKTEVPVAYSTSTSDMNATIDSGNKGTMMYVGDKTGNAVADTTVTAPDADKTFYIGYVEVCAPTATTTGTGTNLAAGDGAVTTSLGNTGSDKAVVKNGSTFNINVALKQLSGAATNGVKATPTVTTANNTATLDAADKTNTEAVVEAGASAYTFTVTVGAENITAISVALGDA